MHYFPFDLWILLLFFLLVAVLIALIEIGIIHYAYEKIGIPRPVAYAFLLLSLLGSYVNIPIATLPGETVMSEHIVSFFGMPIVVPRAVQTHTVLAVNVGGAVIPVLLSTFLLVRHSLYKPAAIGVFVIALFTHWLAEPVPGVGIAIPIFAPPLAAAGVALLLAPKRRRVLPPLAYICGSLGTLIGADLMNLDEIAGLGAPIASIGGAGTFDGIFLTGILAVLLT